MKRIFYFLLVLLFVVSSALKAQTINYSGYAREDRLDINFEIVGKINNNILVYKNISWRHKINIYDNEMNDKGTINLDFIPEKTFNIDFVTYPDFFYMLYQYQKRNIVHCMAVKMDGDGNKLGGPYELDTTQISILADNKIYSTVCSEDKQKIMIFKIQKKYEKINMVTLLFDKQLNLINTCRQGKEYNNRREDYDNFSLDNDGNFVFTIEKQPGNVNYSNAVDLVTKAPLQDSFSYHNLDLGKREVGDVKLKIDNLNSRYILNTFYYKKNAGYIEGLLSYIWDIGKAKAEVAELIELPDSLRVEAKTDGLLRNSFDNYVIRQVVVKKDGGFIFTAEDFTSQVSGNTNPWNRWDNMYNPYSLSSSSYYTYNPYYGYYRPMNSYHNQSTRYYYENVIILSISKNGRAEWSKVIHKEQYDDNNDNFLSFSTMNARGEIHFFYNSDRKNQIIFDQSIAPDGVLKRNPTLKSQEKGYEFMPRLSKQVGVNQLIIPCAYHGYICFAKVDF